MDDSRTLVFSLDAEHEVSGWLEQHRPNLIVRCQESKTELYVNTGGPASVEFGTDTHEVKIRFDSDQQQTGRWSDSTSNDALFAPSPIPLVRRIAKAELLRFGWTPFNASPVIASFDVSGFKEHAEEVAALCGWKL